ncbi:hypothetical protein BGX31_006608, partial [Mortierella sp. GBA43]
MKSIDGHPMVGPLGSVLAIDPSILSAYQIGLLERFKELSGEDGVVSNNIGELQLTSTINNTVLPE